jgi:DNA-binding transcriptional MerR regulator
MADAVRYAIGDLADLASVSRRTVRYYVQEGLLPAPLGVGRGNHYGQEHLDQLLRVKSMQEAGRTLAEIKQAFAGPARQKQTNAHWAYRSPAPIERTVWRRITLAPGVELNVAGNIRLPASGKLQELAEWCREHFLSFKAEDTDA